MEAEKVKKAIKIKNAIKNKNADSPKFVAPEEVVADSDKFVAPEKIVADSVEAQSERKPTAPVIPVITDETIFEFLSTGDNFERIILNNAEICNAVISKYLDELYGAVGVPVVRGYSALSVLPKPKSLADAKKIVDGIF